MFGKTPVLSMIGQNPDATARQILDAIIDGLNRFRRGVQLEDDVTLLVVKIGPLPNAATRPRELKSFGSAQSADSCCHTANVLSQV
jgi:hypothetical protein